MHRPAAVTPIQLLAQKLPYAASAALKKKAKKKKRETALVELGLIFFIKYLLCWLDFLL